MLKDLGFDKQEITWRDEMRPMRLAAEFLAAEMTMKDHAIGSTVVIFGSARIKDASIDSTNPGRNEKDDLSAYLRLAETTANKIAKFSEEQFSQSGSGLREFVICTGGGPSIMEAANKGAADAGGVSIGLNIELPKEQTPNAYISDGLDLRFHYFAMRKMHLMMRARGLIVFPGGFGTLDELFEALTLVQTGKIKRIPIVIFGRSYWEQVINLPHMVACGTISSKDLELITFVDTPDEAFNLICGTS